MRLEIQDSPDKPNQKIVIFYVSERPVIRRIVYKGNKSVTESDILDRFKDRKVGLSIESQFDPTRIKKAEVVLKELLAEHGRQFATVKPTFERVPGTNAVTLTFNIDEGPKVKVGKILITGNTAFSSSKIVRTMHNSRPYAIPLGPLGYVNMISRTFDRPKLDEDMEIGIRGIYQDNGYFKVLLAEVTSGNLSGYQRLSANLSNFVAVATGAKDYTYTGLSMNNAHNPATNPRINGVVMSDDFDEFVKDVAASATKNGVPSNLITSLGNLLYTVESQVINQ